MKRKIKTFLVSIVITELLIAVVFGLATVDIRTRGIAGYMGDSAVTAFQNDAKVKLTELSEEGKEKLSGSFATGIKDTATAIKGLYHAVLLFLTE